MLLNALASGERSALIGTINPPRRWSGVSQMTPLHRGPGVPAPAHRGLIAHMTGARRVVCYFEESEPTFAAVRAKAEQAAAGRKDDDRLACEAWNARMLGFRGPARPSPGIRDGLTAGYLEVKCLGCNVALDIVRGPKITPVHQLGRYLRCRECSAVRRYAFKRSQLIALRQPRSLRRALH